MGPADTDARTVTFATPPAPATAVVATYRGLRLVRISDAPAFQGVTKRYGHYELPLEQLMRETGQWAMPHSTHRRTMKDTTP